MRKFNLVKSLTKVNNITSLPFRKGLGLGRLILCLSLAVLGVNDAWGQFNVTITAQANPAKGGGVYTKESQVKPSDSDYSSPTNTDKEYCATIWSSKTFYAYYKANTGYTFVNWTENSSVYSTNWEISVKCDRDNKNRTVVANFTPITYTINFNGNGASGGSTDKQTFKYDEQKALTANGFKKEYIVTLNADGGTAEANTLTSSAPFLGWATSAIGNVVYSNQQSVSNLSSTQDATINLYAKWGDYPLVTLPQATKSGKVLVGWNDGKTTRLAGETYTPTGNITMTAIWMDSYPFTMSCNVSVLKVEEEKASAFTFTYADNPTPHIADASIIAYNKESNTLTGLKEGTTTIYFTQEATPTIKAGTSDTYTITVSKIANTLVADATHSMKVDETWGSVISGKNSDGKITMISSDETVAYYDVSTNKIFAQNTGNQSFNSKEVTITISQEATYKYTAAEKTITVTVNKWDNHISINGSQDGYQTSIYMDAQQSINLTATNTDYAGSPITATPTSGSTIAVMNDEQTQVASNHNLGTATWTISQPENYKYKAANATLTVNVIQQAEATDCYVLNDAKERSWSTISNSGSYGPFDAAGTTLLFEAERTALLGFSNTTEFYAQYSSDGSNWTNCLTINLENKDQWYPLSCSIPETAKYVRFETKVDATGYKHICNVRVTRKTYLNAGNVEITETSTENPIHPNEVGVGTLTINRSLANGGNLKVKWDNDKFTIDGKTAAQGIDLGDLGCSTGVSDLPISYTSAEAGTHTANVVIYNNVYRATATITGTTIKRNQNIQWNTDIMIVGQIVTNAAQTTSIMNRIVTYTSDDTDVIRVKADDNGQLTILEALQPGTTNITAFSAGNEEYNDAQSTKEITVTDKQIQYITWNQSLMGLKMGDADVPLNASAYQPDSLNCATGGQRPITYSSANTAVVEIVDGNKLRIKGIGVTTVTASQAGGTDQDGHDFIPVTAEKKVVVRDPNAPCETYIYEQTSEVEFDLGWNAASHKTKEYVIDFNGKEPGFVNFDYKGKVHTVLIDYYAGTLSIEQYVNNQWVEVRNFGKPGTSGYTNTGDIALDRKATKMRVKAADGMGYMYFKDCRITLARYLEGATLSTFETKVGAPLTKTLTIKYSNISGPVTFSLSENSNFSISQESIEGECGGYGTTSLDITYTPTTQTIGEEATLTLADDIQKTYIVLKGNASVTPLHINWDIPDNNTCYTIQSVNLSAKALTDLNVEIPNFVWFSLAQNSTTGTLTGNTLTFDKAGNANVVAQTTGDPRYTPAQNIFKNWTVNLTPTTISKLPTIGNIVSGTDKETIVLTDWQVINTVNSEPVEGNLSITAGDLTNAGTKTITLTFTPTNTDMYESCTTDMQVEVFYYTFTGTDGNWADANNWLQNTKPENDTNDVVITGQLTITEDKTFTTLTLNGETSSVSIANDVKVIIQNGSLTEIGTTPIIDYGQMNILSNATLALNGGTFHANRLSFTGGLYKSNETKTYGVPHLYIAPEASMDLTNEDVDYFLNIDAANYYPFAVPFEVPVSSIHYANTEYTYAQCYDWNAAEIDYYDGADRANKNTSSLTNSQYWKPIKTDGNLQPGVGYIISALPLSETEANLQMTMTIPNNAITNGEQAKKVSIVANAGTEKTSWNNKGWNYIANPYMSKFNNNKDDELMLAQEYTGSEGVYEPISPAVRYVTVPSETMSDYTQTPANVAIIEPFRGFFIQAANDGVLSFENGIRAAVPARMSAYQEEAYPEQQAYLRVSDGCNSDMIGLIIHENYSADYDVNADLVKMLGETNSLRSYLTYEGNKMAFLALNQDLAIEAIPVGVRIPKNTIYTWSVDSISNTDMLDALYLMDYTTNTMTNLLVSDYSFTADAGTINERFAINAVVNPNRQPTETRHTITKNQDTQKIIFRNHLYIVHKGIVYDGQGTRVTNIQ